MDDLRAVYSDWKEAAERFQKETVTKLLPTRVEGKLLYFCDRVFKRGDSVVIVSELTVQEFPGVFMGANPVEAGVLLPDGTRCRLPLTYLRQGRITLRPAGEPDVATVQLLESIREAQFPAPTTDPPRPSASITGELPPEAAERARQRRRQAHTLGRQAEADARASMRQHNASRAAVSVAAVEQSTPQQAPEAAIPALSSSSPDAVVHTTGTCSSSSTSIEASEAAVPIAVCLPARPSPEGTVPLPPPEPGVAAESAVTSVADGGPASIAASLQEAQAAGTASMALSVVETGHKVNRVAEKAVPVAPAAADVDASPLSVQLATADEDPAASAEPASPGERASSGDHAEPQTLVSPAEPVALEPPASTAPEKRPRDEHTAAPTSVVPGLAQQAAAAPPTAIDSAKDAAMEMPAIPGTPATEGHEAKRAKPQDAPPQPAQGGAASSSAAEPTSGQPQPPDV